MRGEGEDATHDGPNYIYSLLTGFSTPPHGLHLLVHTSHVVVYWIQLTRVVHISSVHVNLSPANTTMSTMMVVALPWALPSSTKALRYALSSICYRASGHDLGLEGRVCCRFVA